MFHTGGALWRPATGEVVASPLPDGAVDEAARLAAEHGWVFEAYAWDELAVDSDAPLAVAHAELLGIPHRRRSLDSLSPEIVRAQYVVPIDEIAEALACAPDGCTASGATSPSMPEAAFVSVTADGVSKAAGIASVAEHLGASMDEVMMVGDGHNDLSAMAVVGWPVAIGDADPAVIAAARWWSRPSTKMGPPRRSTDPPTSPHSPEMPGHKAPWKRRMSRHLKQRAHRGSRSTRREGGITA